MACVGRRINDHLFPASLSSPGAPAGIMSRSQSGDSLGIPGKSGGDAIGTGLALFGDPGATITVVGSSQPVRFCACLPSPVRYTIVVAGPLPQCRSGHPRPRPNQCARAATPGSRANTATPDDLTSSLSSHPGWPIMYCTLHPTTPPFPFSLDRAAKTVTMQCNSDGSE